MRRILMVLILLTALLCSCGANEATVSYNGTELSAEEIFELSESFPRETESESEAETKPEETVEPADGIVYFSEGGEVWHEWRTCGHLSQKNEIICGSIEDAIAAGKERGCSFCTGK